MRISTHNIACSQRRRQMRAYITQLYIMSIQPANKAVKHLINSETREREGIGKDEFSSDGERERERERFSSDDERDRERETDRHRERFSSDDERERESFLLTTRDRQTDRQTDRQRGFRLTRERERVFFSSDDEREREREVFF